MIFCRAWRLAGNATLAVRPFVSEDFDARMKGATNRKLPWWSADETFEDSLEAKNSTNQPCTQTRTTSLASSIGHTIILLGPSWFPAVACVTTCQTTYISQLDMTLEQLIRFLVNCSYQEIPRTLSTSTQDSSTPGQIRTMPRNFPAFIEVIHLGGIAPSAPSAPSMRTLKISEDMNSFSANCPNSLIEGGSTVYIPQNSVQAPRFRWSWVERHGFHIQHYPTIQLSLLMSLGPTVQAGPRARAPCFSRCPGRRLQASRSWSESFSDFRCSLWDQNICCGWGPLRDAFWQEWHSRFTWKRASYFDPSDIFISLESPSLAETVWNLSQRYSILLPYQFALGLDTISTHFNTKHNLTGHKETQRRSETQVLHDTLLLRQGEQIGSHDLRQWIKRWSSTWMMSLKI